MGIFKIGEAVCNNCVHWRCHSKRQFRGNPPREVYTTSNCDKCGLTGRNTLSKNSCGMFRHIGGISTFSMPFDRVDTPQDLGTAFLSSVLGFMRERQAINTAKKLLNECLHDEDGETQECEEQGVQKRRNLIRHGMSRTATDEEQQAFEVLYEGAVADEPEVQLYLAHCFQHGEYGAVKNARLAAKWCLKSACHENADAQNLLGTFYVKGFGVEKDLRKAGALFRSAAKLGSCEAARNYKAMTGQNN